MIQLKESAEHRAVIEPFKAELLERISKQWPGMSIENLAEEIDPKRSPAKAEALYEIAAEKGYLGALMAEWDRSFPETA